VATAHYMAGGLRSEYRYRQLDKTESFFREQIQKHDGLEACILIADVNWDEKRDGDMAERLRSPFHDLGREVENTPGATYRGASTRGGKGMRLDRVLVFPRVYNSRSFLSYRRVRLIGAWEFPSDHLGVIGEILWHDGDARNESARSVRQFLRRSFRLPDAAEGFAPTRTAFTVDPRSRRTLKMKK